MDKLTNMTVEYSQNLRFPIIQTFAFFKTTSLEDKFEEGYIFHYFNSTQALNSFHDRVGLSRNDSVGLLSGLLRIVKRFLGNQ